MIKLYGIGRAFAGKGAWPPAIKWAVRGVSLHIQRGEIFGLLGPNGAGKTTLIKVLTGLLMPTEGRAFIGGNDVAKEPLAAKSLLGYVPDRPFLYEKLTGREFLIFMASIRKMKKADAIGRIDELIGLLDISEVADELIESYSQGMRQRLLFSSALIHNPPALLIDEPFVGLDPMGVILIKDILRELSGKGASILLATHSLHIASVLCTRVGLINRGELTAIKAKEEFQTEEGGLEGLFLKEAGKGHTAIPESGGR